MLVVVAVSCLATVKVQISIYTFKSELHALNMKCPSKNKSRLCKSGDIESHRPDAIVSGSITIHARGCWMGTGYCSGQWEHCHVDQEMA